MEQEEEKSIRERIKGVETAQTFISSEMSEIKTNVTNHIPHQIAALSEKFDEKFDNTFKAIQTQIEEHTKFDETTYARRDGSWAEKAITRIAWAFAVALILAAATFIVSGGLRV